MEKSTINPNLLISPNFHSTDNKHWYLLKIRIKKLPKWEEVINNNLANRLCIFREIIYVNHKSEYVGFGRSYLPINSFGISLFFKCISPWDPKPLGIVLKNKYSEQLDIRVLKEEKEDKVKCPYRNDVVNLIVFKRVINVKNATNGIDITKTIFVEENFIENLSSLVSKENF